MTTMGPRPTRRRRTCAVVDSEEEEEEGDILLALSTKRRSRKVIDDESDDDTSSGDISNDDASCISSVKEGTCGSDHDENDDDDEEEDDEVVSDEASYDEDGDVDEEDSDVTSEQSDSEDTVSDQYKSISADVDVTPASVVESDDDDDNAEDPWENEEESDYEPEEDDDEELEADIDPHADELRPLQRNLDSSVIEPVDSQEKAMDSHMKNPCIAEVDERFSKNLDHGLNDEAASPSVSQESDSINMDLLDQSHDDQDSIVVEAIVCEDDENVEEVVAEIIADDDDDDESGDNCWSISSAVNYKKSSHISSATNVPTEDPVSSHQNEKSVDCSLGHDALLDGSYSETLQKTKPEIESPKHDETFSSLSNNSNADSITEKIEYSNNCLEIPHKLDESMNSSKRNGFESKNRESTIVLSPKQNTENNRSIAVDDVCDRESLRFDDTQVSSSLLLDNRSGEKNLPFPKTDENSNQQACNDKSYSLGTVPSSDVQPNIEKKIVDYNEKLDNHCATLSQKLSHCVINSTPTSSNKSERLAVKFVDSYKNDSTNPETSKKHSSKCVHRNEVSKSMFDEQNKENSCYDAMEADQSSNKGENIKQRGMEFPKYGREGSVKRGQWKLGTKIGSGAFGVVHVGMNTFTGTLMAVKSVKMCPDAMRDAKREIQLLKSLRHKNVVQYYGAEMDSKYLHIFQEWVPAGSISALLSKFGPFPLVVCCNYLAQISEGLAYLHENHVMHRDIKGSNILVDGEGNVKLADFGASKRIAELHSHMMLSLTMRGTPYFMAPEVFEEKYSSKADIWSIGCVAYQMAMGTPPWKSLGLSNPVSLFSHISKSTGPPEPFSVRPDTDISIIEENFHVEAFKKLVARCFERNPENRPEAKEILHDTLFKTVRTAACDDQSDCSRLFSPSSDRTFDSLASPSLGTSVSPIRPSPRRTHSIGSPMTPFLSPPLPRKMTKSRLSFPIISPIADPSEWPTWARNKHRGAIGAKEIIPKTNESRQSDSMMDSLNFSDDDYISLLDKSINPFLHSTDSSEKNLTSSMAQASLRGLQFVNSTSTADKKRDLDS